MIMITKDLPLEGLFNICRNLFSDNVRETRETPLQYCHNIYILTLSSASINFSLISAISSEIIFFRR